MKPGRAYVLAVLAAVLCLSACGVVSSHPGRAPRAATRAVTARHREAAVSSSRIPSGNWTTFGYNAARSGVGPADTGITRSNLGRLRRRAVQVPGTVDSAPVEVAGLRIGRYKHTVVVVTTSYGISLAIDASTGRKLWQFTPSDVRRLQGSAQITNASPAIDPDGSFVYTASPNGYIHKLRLTDGRQVWSARITFSPAREKIEGALNIDGRTVLASTGGYIGDTPVYQGHLVAIARSNGRIVHVFNTLCSNRRHLIHPPTSCPASDSALLARAGSVLEPGSGRILIATGNAPYNGHTNWGDSVLELSSSLRLLHSYTPVDQAYLNDDDLDLGSSDPALLPRTHGVRLAIQGGKDGILRLLDLDRLDGTTRGAGSRTGGQLQEIDDPGTTDLFSQPAVWSHGGHAYAFVTDGAGTSAYELSGHRRLFVAWSAPQAGTSPVIAGGLLYVYDEITGKLLVRNPVNGHLLISLSAAKGHWNSPIVVGGRIILPVGDDNSHLTSGTLYIFHLPGR